MLRRLTEAADQRGPTSGFVLPLPSFYDSILCGDQGGPRGNSEERGSPEAGAVQREVHALLVGRDGEVEQVL